jgi:aspartokinase
VPFAFSRISDAGISVDLVATSETTTTLAINRAGNRLDDESLASLAVILRERCAVTVYPDCCGINLVGRGARLALAGVDPQSEFFANHPLLMLSQSANDLCLSLLLRAEDADGLHRALHRTMIEKAADAGGEEGVFGPSWQEIQQVH